ILIFLSIVTRAQQSLSRSEFDTLQTYSDKALIDFKFYKDSVLTKKEQGLLFKDSLTFHGIVYSKWEKEKFWVGEFKDGQKLNMTYYSKDSTKLTRQAFYEGFRSQWNPENGTIYFIDGKKE